MGTKYTIEVEDKPFELLSEDGSTSEKLYRVKGFNSLVFDWNGLNMLTPYTAPDLEQVRKEAYDKCMDEAEMLAYKLYSPKIDEAYQKGLSDAWDAARKIWEYDITTLKKIFSKCDSVGVWDIIRKYSASEAIEKIRQYEQEQEEIRVGDEVIGIYSSGEQTKPFVITKVISDYYFGIYSDSGEFCQGGLKLKKTGRHFPEIAEVLKKMREE